MLILIFANFKKIKKSMLVLFFQLYTLFLYAQNSEISFDQSTLPIGLSQSIVKTIIQDQYGFMWFGTENGLNRFDGYQYKVFYHDPDDTNSLSYHDINTICEDKTGMLWIGTFNGGLNRYNPATNKFTRFLEDPSDSVSLSHNNVNIVYEDHGGHIWIGTDRGLNRFDLNGDMIIRYQFDKNTDDIIRSISEDSFGRLWIGTQSGLICFNFETNQIDRFENDPNDYNSLSSNSVRCTFADQRGVVWIGTDNGLNKYDITTKKFTRYFHDNLDITSLSHNEVYAILKDHSGSLWIGTNGGGLNHFDVEKGIFTCYLNNPLDINSLSIDEVRSIYEDRSGKLWIGTYGGEGINTINTFRKEFRHVQFNPIDNNSLNNNIVWCFHEGPFNVLWIGTHGGGLNRYDRLNNKFSSYRYDQNNKYSISSNIVRAIHRDRNNIYWIGTHGGGLNRFDPQTERFTHYKYDSNDSNNISHNEIRCLHEDHSGILWIGTYGGGLNRFDKEKQTFIQYRADVSNLNSLSNDFVRVIFEDPDDSGKVLWIGTEGGGLNRFDKKSGLFKQYKFDPDDPNSLNSNFIFSIHEDQEGVLWIATFSGGLNRFDKEFETFTSYTMTDGLPSNAIYGILEENNDVLWLSTPNGLSKFDKKNTTFTNYTVADGLQNNEFNGGSYYKSSKGEMFFGGIRGYNSFFPDEIIQDKFIPPIVFTDFQIFNREVTIGEFFDDRIILSKSITQTEIINLSYKDAVISFGFCSLHFAYPQRNQYAYFLDGFENEWNFIGNRQYITYTNLPPGYYNLRVKGSNSDGIWNEQGISLGIKIVPPFWMTLWFRILIIILIAGTVFGIYEIRVRNIRLKKDRLEKQVAERTKELNDEIKERKKAQTEIIKRENYLKSVLYNAPDAIITTDPQSRIIEWNPGAKKLFQYSREEVLGQLIDDLLTNKSVKEEAEEFSKKIISGKKIVSFETIRYRKDGKPVNVIISASPIQIKKKLFGYVVVYTDITNRKKDEEAIKKSLREKEILLKEIHHRVKNNLTVVSSLLNLQSHQIKDERDLELFRESQNRVQMMALIHEKLYKSKDLSNIEFGSYIEDLTNNLYQAYGINPDRIQLIIDIQNVSLGIDKAIPCGLIINELISNSMKYAFPLSWKGEGKIIISLHPSGDNEIELIVQDNGVGLQDNMNIKASDTLGLKIVQILAEEQLKGTLKIHIHDGLKYIIRFCL